MQCGPHCHQSPTAYSLWRCEDLAFLQSFCLNRQILSFIIGVIIAVSSGNQGLLGCMQGSGDGRRPLRSFRDEGGFGKEGHFM